MIRTYVTNMSLQTRNDLGKVFYHPKGFSLTENRTTRFPIIPIIAENLKEEDPVKVIVLRTINEDTPDNLSLFYEELKELGISDTQVTVIDSIENQDRMTLLNILFHLISAIDNDSLVCFDVTFGTKPMSSLLVYAASFLPQLKDVQLGGIYYGEIPRKSGKPVPGAESLYDMTYFSHLGNLIQNLHELGCDDPEQMLHTLLDI